MSRRKLSTRKRRVSKKTSKSLKKSRKIRKRSLVKSKRKRGKLYGGYDIYKKYNRSWDDLYGELLLYPKNRKDEITAILLEISKSELPEEEIDNTKKIYKFDSEDKRVLVQLLLEGAKNTEIIFNNKKQYSLFHPYFYYISPTANFKIKKDKSIFKSIYKNIFKK